MHADTDTPTHICTSQHNERIFAAKDRHPSPEPARVCVSIKLVIVFISYVRKTAQRIKARKCMCACVGARTHREAQCTIRIRIREITLIVDVCLCVQASVSDAVDCNIVCACVYITRSDNCECVSLCIVCNTLLSVHAFRGHTVIIAVCAEILQIAPSSSSP